MKIWEKQPGGFFESGNNGLVVNGGAMFPHDSGVIIIHPLYAANGPIRGQYWGHVIPIDQWEASIIHPLWAANASGLDNGSDTGPHETMTTEEKHDTGTLWGE